MDTTGIDYSRVMQELQTAGRDVLDHACAAVADLDPEIVVRTELDLADARALLLELSDEASMIVVGRGGEGPSSVRCSAR